MKKNLLKFGEMLRDLRIKKNLSLREICKLADFDPSNYSKIERGLMAPPSDEKVLIKWAKILGLTTKGVREFMDEAQIAQGIIPEDILSDSEALKLMPAFFRTVRNEKPTKQEIEKLFRLIKNNK
jgi:transcriptional regulator with XRE-family HTH domain